MEYIIALGVFVFFVLFWIYENRKNVALLKNAFAGRESISNETFYETYFKEQKIPENIVYGIKRILEEQLDTDLSKLSAEDDFSTNLNFFFAIDSMADVEIVIALEKEFNIKVSDTEAEATHTIRDIVDLVWRKINERIKGVGDN